MMLRHYAIFIRHTPLPAPALPLICRQRLPPAAAADAAADTLSIIAAADAAAMLIR